MPKLLGVPTDAEGEGFFGQLWIGVRSLGSATPATLALAAATVTMLFLIGRFVPRAGVLFALIGTMLVGKGIGGLEALVTLEHG